MQQLACPSCHSPELSTGNSQLTCLKCFKQFYPGSAAVKITDDVTGVVTYRNACKVVAFKVMAKKTAPESSDH